MDEEHPEKHKFIIPNLIREQPGLEVNPPLELDASSPEVAHAPPHLRLTESQQYLRSPDGSLPQRLGSSASSRSRQDTDYLLSALSRTSVSGLELRYPGGNSPRMESVKIEEPPLTPQADLPHERKRILGLSVVWFWAMLFIFVGMIAVGIAVGVAVGLTNSSEATSTTNATATPTNGQGVSSPAPTNPFCPGQNGTVITPYDTSGTVIQTDENSNMQFTMLCNTFWPSRHGINPGVRDIMVMYAPDMLICLTLCAEYNAGYSNAIGDDVGVGGGMCIGVALVRGPAEFCYLKNATGVNDTSAAGGSPVDSALIVGNWSTLTPREQRSIFAGFQVKGPVW